MTGDSMGEMGADITGVVLAGGLSSRLGQDKARIALAQGGAADFLSRTVAILATCCSRVIIAGREYPEHEYCLDIIPGMGPVGGIATALAMSGGACLVLSCDLPFMETAVLERLIAHRSRRFAGTLATMYRHKDTGQVEALVAIYEQGALPYFQAAVRDNRLKISRAVPQSMQHFLEYQDEEALPFFNINYPADLVVARKIAEMKGS